MATQTFETHRHNPWPSGLAFAFLVLAVVAFALRWFGIGGRLMFASGLGALLAVNLVLIAVSRTYTTKLQDRIIKLEMKVRCAPLLSPAQRAAFERLSKPQIVAMRFASDAELPALLERAEQEQLSPDQIKRAIKNWVADLDRT